MGFLSECLAHSLGKPITSDLLGPEVILVAIGKKRRGKKKKAAELEGKVCFQNLVPQD